jgi:hypothetical protein
MSRTALVTTELFCDREKREYRFSTADVMVMGRLYLFWDKKSKNEMYPIRVEMARANWELFRSWFQQFVNVTSEGINDVADDIAEYVILQDAIRRAQDPIRNKAWVESLKGFSKWLEHEPLQDEERESLSRMIHNVAKSIEQSV